MFNQATLIGHVGKLEHKTSKSGVQFSSISLATSNKVKGSDGQYKEQTTWHQIYCFSKLSEMVAKFVKVGDMVFVQGEIQHKKIDSGERAGQYSYSVSATSIRFMPKPKVQVQAQPTSTVASDNDDDVPW